MKDTTLLKYLLYLFFVPLVHFPRSTLDYYYIVLIERKVTYTRRVLQVLWKYKRTTTTYCIPLYIENRFTRTTGNKCKANTCSLYWEHIRFPFP